jgi:hypothetical protein
MQLGMKDQMPHILFDCQFLPGMNPKEYGRVIRAGGHVNWVGFEFLLKI